jgi:hypothetical protein
MNWIHSLPFALRCSSRGKRAGYEGDGKASSKYLQEGAHINRKFIKEEIPMGLYCPLMVKSEIGQKRPPCRCSLVLSILQIRGEVLETIDVLQTQLSSDHLLKMVGNSLNRARSALGRLVKSTTYSIMTADSQMV